MDRCLTSAELATLLADAPAPPARDAWETHLGRCETCQRALLDLSAGPPDRSSLRLLTPASDGTTLPEPSAEFLRSLKAAFVRSPDAAPAAGRLNISGYQITGELGRGGTAVVYLARQLGLNRDVALKVIHAGPGDPARLARFRAEAEAVARLRHPDIVHVHEVGEADGVPFLCLEYVSGGTLAARIAGKPQPPREAAALVERLARAVHAAHEHGIVHRDLKPANVLLTDDGAPKIADFGLVKHLGDDAAGTPTRTGDVLGTPCYMAPEQASPGAQVGPAADVYGLGVILYELLAGRPPFRAASTIETILQVLHNEPPSPSRFAAGVPRDLETIALKCLEKEPGRRYGSAAALADDLRRFLDGRPIAARPVGEAERVWKWARRRPTVAGLLVGLFGVTLTGFVGVSVALVQAREAQTNEATQRKAAEDSRERAEQSVYLGTIAQARSQWLLNNVAGAARLLDGCPAERRGWEWHFLHALNHTDLRTIPEAEGGPYVFVLAYSPDGTRLAVGGGNPYDRGGRGIVRVHDADGQLVWQRTGLPGLVRGLAFRPDGRHLVTATGSWFEQEGGELALWDAGSGELVRRFDSPPERILWDVAFHPNGRHLAASGATGGVRVWDADTGGEVRRLPSGAHTWGVAYHPDGRVLVSGSDTSLRFWDAETGAELASRPIGTDRVALSPDGRSLATTHHSPAVRVWDTAGLATGAGPTLTHLFSGHGAVVHGVAFAPDAGAVATACADSTVHTWNLRTGLEEAVYRGHHGRAAAVAFHPAGRVLASGAQQPGDVKLWDRTRPVEYILAISFSKEHADIEAIGFAPDGVLTAATLGGRLRSWDPTGGATPERSLPLTRTWMIPTTRTTFAADGGRVVGVPDDDPTRVGVWEAATGRHLMDLHGCTRKVWHTACDRTGARVVATANGERGKPARRELRVWDADTGRVLFTEDTADEWTVSLALSPDGARFAESVLVGNTGSAVRLRSVAPEGAAVPLTGVPGGRVVALAFRADGRVLAGGLDTGAVVLWDAETGRPLLDRPIEGVERIAGLAFHPDGSRLAAVTRDLVRVWDTGSGQEVLALRGAGPRPSDIGFNPRIAWSRDGRWLAASHWDRTVSVWSGRAP